MTHGHRRGRFPSPTYNSWRAMRARCNYPTHPYYPNYGGRGIRVCERWRFFAHFLADMGERPAGTTLDRIDPELDYEPGNCRWATPLQQRWNRRDMAAVREIDFSPVMNQAGTGVRSEGCHGDVERARR
jgi:hypothetical protein